MSDEGVGKTSSYCIIFSGSSYLSFSTDIPSPKSVAMSASVTVIPQLTEGRMHTGVSSTYLSLNLSTPSSGWTTDEAMEESREGLFNSKSYFSGPYSVICTILLVAYKSLFGKYS